MPKTSIVLHDGSNTLVAKPHVIRLTRTEYALLRYLYSKRGVVVSREELIHAVWKDRPVFPNVIDATVKNLRRKVKKKVDYNPILTSYGQGYYFTQS